MHVCAFSENAPERDLIFAIWVRPIAQSLRKGIAINFITKLWSVHAHTEVQLLRSHMIESFGSLHFVNCQFV